MQLRRREFLYLGGASALSLVLAPLPAAFAAGASDTSPTYALVEALCAESCFNASVPSATVVASFYDRALSEVPRETREYLVSAFAAPDNGVAGAFGALPANRRLACLRQLVADSASGKRAQAPSVLIDAVAWAGKAIAATTGEPAIPGFENQVIFA